MDNLFLILLFAALSLLILGFVMNARTVKPFKSKLFLYFLTMALLLGVAGFFTLPDIRPASATSIYVILSGWMLLTGVAHTYMVNTILSKITGRHCPTNLALSCAIAFMGAALLSVAFSLANYSLFVTTNLTSVLMFPVPFLFYSTYILYMDIPVKVLRKWHYPVDKHIDDPTDREMESPLVIGFEFRKKADDVYMTTFRAKAPREMIFGKLFYYFINDYNDRNPDEKIVFMDEQNKPYGWIFYHKPKWFSSIRYIDPDDTNSFNLIRENSVIVCKRVIEK